MAEIINGKIEKRHAYIVEELFGRAKSHEVVDLLGRGKVFLAHNPNGIETRDLLDEGHMPGVTRFTDIVFSPVFSALRNEPANLEVGVVDVQGDLDDLRRISTVAKGGQAYLDDGRGKPYKRVYLESCARSLSKVYERFPINHNEVVVGVRRAGSNVARRIGLNSNGYSYVEEDAKRLRFGGTSEMLGAGVAVNNEEFLRNIEGRRIRLAECISAAGTTMMAFTAISRNWRVPVEAVELDAVVVIPSGAKLASEFQSALGISGVSRAAFKGGKLNKDWYGVYGENDPLFEAIGTLEVGAQIMGDAGDQTSNA